MNESLITTAGSIEKKIREISSTFRYTANQKDSFVSSVAKKTMARLVRPVTEIIKEISALQTRTLSEVALLESDLRAKTAEASRLNARVDDLNTQIGIVTRAVNENRASTVNDKHWDQFYKNFEDRFRGAEELISIRLKDRYQIRLSSLHSELSQKSDVENIIALDLGCGRGEFLNLARSAGFVTKGIDISPAMVESSKQQGHEAHVGDAVAALQAMATGTISLISLFHVVEHMSPNSVFHVFNESARVLVPGGVLLVETPSLFSLWASSRQFYLDPSHTFPVHPDYMKFVAEHAGFSRREILEFDPVLGDERPHLASTATPEQAPEFLKLERWLYGPMDVGLWAVR